MSHLPADLYATIEQSMPIACVDFVPKRVRNGEFEVGLILRDSPFGEVWCHLGGRILRGESIAAAIRRHAVDTLGDDIRLDLPDDPQPDYVYQWFPPDDTPADAPAHGVDPRKHAIGLSFLVEIAGEVAPRNEARAFAFAPLTALPTPLWPGTQGLLDRMLTHSA